jgi:hypothetical protein
MVSPIGKDIFPVKVAVVLNNPRTLLNKVLIIPIVPEHRDGLVLVCIGGLINVHRFYTTLTLCIGTETYQTRVNV